MNTQEPSSSSQSSSASSDALSTSNQADVSDIKSLVQHLLRDKEYQCYMNFAEDYIRTIDSATATEIDVIIQVLVAYRKDEFEDMRFYLSTNTFEKNKHEILRELYQKCFEKWVTKNGIRPKIGIPLPIAVISAERSMICRQALDQIYQRTLQYPNYRINYGMLCRLTWRTREWINHYLHLKKSKKTAEEVSLKKRELSAENLAYLYGPMVKETEGSSVKRTVLKSPWMKHAGVVPSALPPTSRVAPPWTPRTQAKRPPTATPQNGVLENEPTKQWLIRQVKPTVYYPQPRKPRTYRDLAVMTLAQAAAKGEKPHWDTNGESLAVKMPTSWKQTVVWRRKQAEADTALVSDGRQEAGVQRNVDSQASAVAMGNMGEEIEREDERVENPFIEDNRNGVADSHNGTTTEHPEIVSAQSGAQQVDRSDPIEESIITAEDDALATEPNTDDTSNVPIVPLIPAVSAEPGLVEDPEETETPNKELAPVGRSTRSRKRTQPYESQGWKKYPVTAKSTPISSDRKSGRGRPRRPQVPNAQLMEPIVENDGASSSPKNAENPQNQGHCQPSQVQNVNAGEPKKKAVWPCYYSWLRSEDAAKQGNQKEVNQESEPVVKRARLSVEEEEQGMEQGASEEHRAETAAAEEVRQNSSRQSLPEGEPENDSANNPDQEENETEKNEEDHSVFEEIIEAAEQVDFMVEHAAAQNVDIQAEEGFEQQYIAAPVDPWIDELPLEVQHDDQLPGNEAIYGASWASDNYEVMFEGIRFAPKREVEEEVSYPHVEVPIAPIEHAEPVAELFAAPSDPSLPPRCGENFMLWSVSEMAAWVLAVSKSEETCKICQDQGMDGESMGEFLCEQVQKDLKIQYFPWRKLTRAAQTMIDSLPRGYR